MRALTALLAAALLAGCGADPDPGTIRILPLGDSITDGFGVPGAYRTELYRRLTAAGMRVDFVGSRRGGPRDLPDRDHEGHPGLRIDEIDADVTKWVNATDPRIVLVHLGTNDVVQDARLAEAPQRLGRLIDHIAATAPDADIYVASLVPLADPAWQARADAFNAALPDLVAAKGPRVHLVDMRAALTVADLDDGVHPSAAGYAKMAGAWAAALGPGATRSGR
ncbi:SGNH/GDSL hydrolase family protein [Dactylosporangium sp. NPDC051485]|uniref:SGNH/GDSL hydrolase family protein n=1 Tax=Dactylosporangium sp. NPDC051485 TaxID=3154846 RepID=UPI00343FD28D